MDEKTRAVLEKAKKSGKASFCRVSLAELPPELFELENLTHLDLSRCGLTELPAEISRLSRLIELDVSGNPLVGLPDTLAELPLEVLRFYDCAFREFPEVVYEIGSIKEFRCPEGLLKEFPPRILSWKKLRLLDLRGTEVGSLPEEFYQLKSLKLLTLLGCRLTSLPPEIGHLKNLKHLGLERNALTSLPAELFQLGRLENLYLAGNRIELLPDGEWGLPKLKKFNISQNPLTCLPPALATCPSLQLISAEHCSLQTLPTEVTKCSNLERLELEGNPLPLSPGALELAGNPFLSHTQGFLEYLDSYGGSHPAFGGVWPDDQRLSGVPGESLSDALARQFNEIGTQLTVEESAVDELPRGAVENFLAQEFRHQLTDSGFQRFVETYGWSESLRGRLKNGFMKIGARRFWRYCCDYEKAVPSVESLAAAKKALSKLDLEVFRLVQNEEPRQLLEQWLDLQGLWSPAE